MKLKFNKALLSLSTAFLMITSIMSIAASAAVTNEIKLSADKTTVKPGDKVNVTMSLNPDSDGVAGFTINLHYDPEQVSVYIPSDQELESTYKVSDKFSVIANYGSSSGTVRIVGANLNSTNVKTADKLALATFTVKPSAKGNINYWVDVETLAKSSGSSFSSTGYSAPLQKSPFKISVDSSAATSLTTKPTTTTTVTTTTTAAPTTTTTTSKPTTTSTTAATTSETTSTSQTTAQTTVAETEKTTSVSSQVSNAKPLYSYKNGETDYNSDGTVQYSFRISNYIDDYSQNYNIKVNLKTTGNASGVIGLQNNGKWTAQSNKTSGKTQDSWIYKNVDPNTSSDLVYLQVYYLKANAVFEITSVEFIPANDIVTTTSATTTASTESSSTTKSTETSIQTSAVTSSETTSVSTTVETTAKTTETSRSTSTKSETSVATTSSAALTSTEKAVSTSKAEESNKVLSMVDSAAEQSGTPQNVKNPDTGSNAVMNVLTLMAIGYIAFSLFVIIYNRATREKEDSQN